jgi:hypothetical protein
MRSASLIPLLLLAVCGRALAFDANGVAIGGTEQEILKKFPSARCQPLEWKSKAADRRCDDGRIAFAGNVEARITFYLRKGVIEAFDLRFKSDDLAKVVAYLKGRYGPPLAETRDKIERKDKQALEIYRVRWESGREHALLIAQGEKGKPSFLASRGDFDQEIYQVR